MNASTTSALREYLLAFADDEHLMGQQHTEWIGVAPFLEEDLAFSSIGQDELGHAVLLYELVCGLDGVEPTDAAIDELAYGRAGEDYRSSAFTEYVTTDWAEALVRHWIYDMIEARRWEFVAGSTHGPLASVAVRAEREEVYHRRHAQALMDSLLATAARSELEQALETVLTLLPSLFAPVAGEQVLVSAQVVAGSLGSIAPLISKTIGEAFGTPIDLAVGEDGRTERSEYFAPLMKRMREVLDLDPEAVW